MNVPTEEQRRRFYNLLDSAWTIGLSTIERFGTVEQTARAIEELAELQVAFMHWRRGHPGVPASSVRSEIADVVIVALQLAMMFGVEGTIEELGAKTKRLEQLVAENRSAYERE